jgi:hypothetical protein
VCARPSSFFFSHAHLYTPTHTHTEYMIIGESAGVAMAMAWRAGGAVQDVDIPTLQASLRARGQKIDL